jgi:hypothetical protein
VGRSWCNLETKYPPLQRSRRMTFRGEGSPRRLERPHKDPTITRRLPDHEASDVPHSPIDDSADPRSAVGEIRR